jgi:hypothetical protein
LTFKMPSALKHRASVISLNRSKGTAYRRSPMQQLGTLPACNISKYGTEEVGSRLS